MDSILTSVKKLLGVTEEYTHFDTDIIMHINSVFTILTQLGVGPSAGFSISDSSAVWTDFIDETPQLELVKSYMYLRVRLLFDSTTMSGTVVESINRQISEFEWRLQVGAELNSEE
ncbi:MAG: hypothetical protein LUE29_09745 [Lachnospiraceae bacterium]|nr:hypothetical protein [Lachnospiraceae bacterium]